MIHNVLIFLVILFFTACGESGDSSNNSFLTAPQFTSTGTVSVYENQISALTLAATDNQSSISYSILGADAASFNVDATLGIVTFKSVPNYEVKSSYSFTAKATDTAGNSVTQNVSITVIDIDESVLDTTAPQFTSTGTVSVYENQISALTLVATDNQSSISYSILGADAASFNVDATSGIVTFKSVPNYEVKSSYSFTAKATDTAGNNVTQNVSISIADVDDLRSVIRTVNLETVAQAQGQTIGTYLQNQFDQMRLGKVFDTSDTIIFQSYITGATSVYKSGNWASLFDFSGVPWNDPNGGALVTDQYVVYAAHYPRSIGSTVYFNAPDGTVVSRTIIGSRNLKSYDGTIVDAAVHKLNAPVPSNIKVYKLLDSQGLGALSGLIGAPYLITDKTRHVFAEEIYSFNSFDNGTYNGTHIVNYWKNNSLPSSMFHAAVSGDSGNPQFMIVNGELVLTGTLFFYSNGKMINDFYGFEALQNSLQQAIDDMSGL